MKKTLISLSLFTSLGAMAQNGGIAINNTGQNPNANAMLDIQSDNKGILIPRLTTVARNTLGTALALPDNGMMVYDKDMNLFFYWDGTQWVQVGSGSGDNWGTQVVQTSGTNISGDGTTGNPLTVTDGDSDPTNEIELPTGGTNGQVLSTNGSGTYTWVNDNAGTDNQNIQNLAFDASTNILTVGIQNGNSQTVDLTALLNDADSDPNNEIQDLSLNTTTNILTITNNGTPTNIDLTPYLDNTDNQDLSLTGNTLSLTNDGTPVDLSGYLDNTDSQNLSNTTAGSNVTVNISGGAGTTFSINDADSDPTNEIELPSGGTNGQVLSTNGSGTYTWVTDNAGTDNQDLSLTGNTLSLTNDGTPVDLSGYLDNTDSQNLSNTIAGSNVTVNISGGTGTTFSINDADSDPTNEIELPSGGTNGQVLSTNGSGTYTWVTDNAGTDNQDLSLTGNTLSLTNDGTPVDLSGYLDNTDNQNISGSGLSGTTLTIGIQNGTSETVDLSSLVDHDWYKVGTTSPPTSINDDIFTQGKVGIGVLTPVFSLDVRSQASSESLARFSSLGNVNVQLDGGTGLHQFFRLMENSVGKWEFGNSSLDNNTFYFNSNVGSGITGAKMVMQQNGNIGISTTTPTSKLEIIESTSQRVLTATKNFNGLSNTEGAFIGGTDAGFSNTGIYVIQKDNMSLSSSGTNIFNVVNNSTSQLVVKGTGNVGISTLTPTEKLEVQGSVKIVDGTQGNRKILTSDATGKGTWEVGPVQEASNGTYKRICSGSTTPGSGWVYYSPNGIYIDVNTSGCSFTNTPRYITSIGGTSGHWETTGGTSIYMPTPTGFRVYLYGYVGGSAVTTSAASAYGYHVNWMAIGD